MSTNKVPFTAGRVSKFCCEAGKAASFLWDADSTGLGLKAASGGSKNYVLQSRLETGATLRLTIGSTKTWTLSAARDEARRLQTMIDQGIDPRDEKRERIAVAEAKRVEAKRVAAPALDAWNAYLVARTPRWSPRSLADHQGLSDEGGKPKTRGRKAGEGDTTLPGALLPLLALPLEQIDADHVRAWLQDEASHRPTQAMFAFVRLRAFLNWCGDRPEYRGQTHTDACLNRMARDEVPKAQAKDDCLQREQLALWFEHVRKLANPVHSAYLQALLLTGARREELAWLKWEDVDFRWQSLTIRDKVEGERTIPLTPYVA